MPEVGLNREFLHRACVQFSSSLADKSSVEVEKQHTLRFVRLHAAMHVSEIARALVWRVVDTDDDKQSDRAGAWELLNAVIMECGEPKNDLSRTSLASKLLLFLPYLISHRWYTTVMAPVSVLNKHNASVNSTHHKKGADSDSDSDNNNDEDEGKNKRHSKSKKRRRSLSTEHNHKLDKSTKHHHREHHNPYEEKEQEEEEEYENQEHRQHKYKETHNDVPSHTSHSSLSSSQEEKEKEEEQLEIKEHHRRHRQSTLNTTLALAGTGKVIPATIINGGEQVIVDIQQVRAFQLQYHKFLDTWKRVWRSDIYQGLREVVRQVEHHGHSLTEKAQEYLSIPATFKDSLWRLRKNNPRPATTLHMLYCYGWKAESEMANNNNLVRPKTLILPSSDSDIASLDRAMHPTVRSWLSKLISFHGGCRLCDTWRHYESRCPCELPFVKTPTDESEMRRRRGGSGAMSGINALSIAGMSSALISSTNINSISGNVGSGFNSSDSPRFSILDAIDKLYRYNIHLPLRTDVVLDRITQLIRDEQPYEELLFAFDLVRGAVTGAPQRHALWLHASYNLLPSKTVFDKVSDKALSSSLQRAEVHFKKVRRFREWDQLLRAVELIDIPFRRRQLSRSLQRCLREIRETTSFFFCLVDGSLPSHYTSSTYARVPEEVTLAAAWKDSICHVCLEPFHCAYTCPYRESSELWDLQVARLVLEDNSLVSLNYPDEMQKLDEALARIDQDDRKAKEFRKNELQLAVHLIHEAKLPICSECNMVGHSTRRCVAHARRVLAREEIHEVDLCLNPKEAEDKMASYYRDHLELEQRELREAYELFYRGVRRYPSSYAAAIRELDDARIPLAAARYATDAVQGFLLYINSSDLLLHLAVFRDMAFPEICLFCDSYHHTSETCERASEEERGFLRELRQYGLDLWQYLKKTDYYDHRLPFIYIRGQESVMGLVKRFEKDYALNGIARVKFMEYNGLKYTMAGVHTQVGKMYSSQGVITQSLPNSEKELFSQEQEQRESEECYEQQQQQQQQEQEQDYTPAASDGNNNSNKNYKKESLSLASNVQENEKNNKNEGALVHNSPYGDRFSELIAPTSQLTPSPQRAIRNDTNVEIVITHHQHHDNDNDAENMVNEFGVDNYNSDYDIDNIQYDRENVVPVKTEHDTQLSDVHVNDHTKHVNETDMYLTNNIGGSHSVIVSRSNDVIVGDNSNTTNNTETSSYANGYQSAVVDDNDRANDNVAVVVVDADNNVSNTKRNSKDIRERRNQVNGFVYDKDITVDIYTNVDSDEREEIGKELEEERETSTHMHDVMKVAVREDIV